MIVSDTGSGNPKSVCPIGVYCLKSEDPNHDINKCVGMTFQFKVFPKHVSFVEQNREQNKSYAAAFQVELPDRTMMAWMDSSVIFICNPNQPGEWSKSKTVDGRKLCFHLRLNEGLINNPAAKTILNCKIEVWKKYHSTKQENTAISFKRLELDYLADLTIQCGDKSIEVHKVLLAQTSEFFRGKD